MLDAGRGRRARDLDHLPGGLRVLLDLDAREACSAEPGDVVVEHKGSADAAHEGLEISADRCRRLDLPGHVGNGQAPAALQHAMDLPEGPVLVGHEIQHTIADNNINRAILDGQAFDLTHAKFDIVQAGFPRVSRAFASMASVISTPMTRPVGPTFLAASRQSKPAPEPRSSTTSPGFKAANACGFPQERPEVGPFRQRGKFLSRIADRQRDHVGVLGAAAKRTAACGTLGHGGIAVSHHVFDLVAFHAFSWAQLYGAKRIYEDIKSRLVTHSQHER